MAASNVVDQPLQHVEGKWSAGDRGAKQARRWFSKAGETVQEYAEAAREAVSERSNGSRAADAAGSARTLLENVGETIR